MLSAYWTNPIHSIRKTHIEEDSSGKRKRFLHVISYHEIYYIPINQIDNITHGDQQIVIEKTDGTTELNLDYVRFGDMPPTMDMLEKMTEIDEPTYSEYYDIYFVSERKFVSQHMAEYIKSKNLHERHPAKSLHNIIYEISNRHRLSIRNDILLETVEKELQMEVIRSLDGLITNPNDIHFNCKWQDEQIIQVQFDDTTFDIIKDIL